VQIALIALFVLAWQYATQIKSLRGTSHLFDPFFVSQPSRIGASLYHLSNGTAGRPEIWGYVWPTLFPALVGTAIGMLGGALLGLVLSSSRLMNDIFRPFVIAVNAIPRVALIPIIVLLFGITFSTSLVISILVVFFVAFFNAFEGGSTVPPQLLQNAGVLGASKWQSMLHVRLPFVLAWTLACLPLALTFSLLSVVTGEILTGYHGLGSLLSYSTQSVDATLTFSIVVVLSVIGLIVVGLGELMKKRVLHWWGE
jgi:NitT/TauT family transport system permease protein